MQKTIQHWVDELLGRLGFTSEQLAGTDHWVILLLIVVASVAVYALARFVIARAIRRVVVRTKVTWDDLVFNEQVMRRMCDLIIPVAVYVLLPVAFPRESEAIRILMRLLEIATVVVTVRLCNALVAVAFQMLSRRPEWRSKPIGGLRQTGQGIVMLIGGILIVSIVLGRSPAILLTGLGASAAVLMLIFRDSILGFVSGIQLSANNMLKEGDWISMPKYGADGTVEEVSLTTVKIRNWDNTIVTLPPYLLVSDSFQNWEGMRSSGGRRVMRSVNIDVGSVRFCTPEMLEKYRSVGLLRDYIDTRQQDIDRYNASLELEEGLDRLDGRHQTNLGVFRAYLLSYLRAQVRIRTDMTLMVRQLEPTATGIPMQLYFFTDTVVWTEYESIQSDVFDHVLAVIPEFDLRVFQNPTGNDLRALRERPDDVSPTEPAPGGRSTE